MKRFTLGILMYLFVVLGLGAYDFGSQSIALSPGTIPILNQDGSYTFVPADNAEALLLKKKVRLAGGYESTITKDGKLLTGRLAEACSYSNDYASVFIPAQSEFFYVPNYKDYVFRLEEGVHSILQLGDITLDYYYQALVYEDNDINATIGKTTTFIRDEREYRFYKNATLFIYADDGPSLSMNAIDEPNKLDLLFFNPGKALNDDEFAQLLLNPNSYGSRIYINGSIKIKLDPSISTMEFSEITNKPYSGLTIVAQNTKLRSFAISSYQHQLLIILRDSANENKKALIQAFVDESQVEELSRALDQGLSFYASFTFGNINGTDAAAGLLHHVIIEKDYLEGLQK